MEMAITKSHKRLTLFFMREYLVKGEKGLPPHSEVLDPMESDEEFEDRIKREYAQKTVDYEEQSTKGRRMMANHRVAHRHAPKNNKKSALVMKGRSKVSNIEKWHQDRKNAKTSKQITG